MSNWTPFSCPVAALHVFDHSAGASQVHCGQILRASKATGPDVPNLALHCLQNWWNHFTEFRFASVRYERLAGLLREFRDCLRMGNEQTWANPRIPQVRVLEVFGCSRSTHCKPMVRPLQVKRLAGKATFVRILVCESAPFSRQHDGVLLANGHLMPCTKCRHCKAHGFNDHGPTTVAIRCLPLHLILFLSIADPLFGHLLVPFLPGMPMGSKHINLGLWPSNRNAKHECEAHR